MTLRGIAVFSIVAAFGGVLLATPPVLGATSEADDAVTEILQVLRNRGLLDQSEYERLASKHEMQQGRAHADVAADKERGLLSGFDWSGDLRLRYEGFRPDDGSDRDLFRYRLRFGFTKAINDWLTVGMRLASGDCVGGGGCEGGTPRSPNRSLGSGEDFDLDPLWVDRAYASIRLPEGPAGLENTLVAGKMSNPFHWKEMPDLVVWDGDIAVEGFVIKSGFSPSEGSEVFSRVGYLVSNETRDSHDPHVTAVQLGGTTSLSDVLSAGLRGSGYFWHSLDGDFREAAESWGNLPTAFDDGAEIGELVGFVKVGTLPEWPVKLYGMYAKNFTAESGVVETVSTGAADVAWGGGIELGSSSRIVKLGVGYYEVEANSVIASMTDTDLFDGKTNRKGWVFTGSRKLTDDVAVKASLYKSRVIDDSEPYALSRSEADRYRFRTDFEIKY